MKREIKFRAWDSKTVKMWTCEIGNQQFDLWHELTLPQVTVMQFTGLHDKQGKEIYEGDILKDDEPEPLTVTWFSLDAGFGLNFKSFSEPMSAFHTENMEVIGNVFEHPSLLTVSQ